MKLALGIIVTSVAAIAETVPAIGTINFVEGEVSIDALPILSASSGSSILRPQQILRTGNGMAEILLNAGSFLRVGANSEVSLDANPLRIHVQRGEAMLESLASDPKNPIIFDGRGLTFTVERPGLYDFDTQRDRIQVDLGEGRAEKNGRSLGVPSGSAVDLRRVRLLKTDQNRSNPLYAWSKTRSEQLSEATRLAPDSAQPDTGRWFWNPWWGSYSFMPATGFLTDPFGWPFYAPGYSHNYIPAYRGGDSYLYGRPIPGFARPPAHIQPVPTPPAVPLTSPGEPSFPTSR